ncbi:hypothetical protein NPIL_324841 [Nephila pilipes]|uniref:Uncharacterized protein n=1 Tax=Nephila pilipes TaxID=299642 RepID=A0A8X6U463_NEPPI|nr:hypothetical protein NPIL_324841 [Nephila pilipes]
MFNRKFISLEVKIQILDPFLKEEKASLIQKSLNLNEATVLAIKKDEKEIRSVVAVRSSMSTEYTARSWVPIIEKTEKASGSISASGLVIVAEKNFDWIVKSLRKKDLKFTNT